jgi:hypothetical protein
MSFAGDKRKFHTPHAIPDRRNIISTTCLGDLTKVKTFYLLIKNMTLLPLSTTNVYGNVYGYGGFTGSAYTTTLPPQTVNIYKPAAMVSIKMSNNLAPLQSVGVELLGGQRMAPGDAAFISQNVRQQLGVKGH